MIDVGAVQTTTRETLQPCNQYHQRFSSKASEVRWDTRIKHILRWIIFNCFSSTAASNNTWWYTEFVSQSSFHISSCSITHSIGGWSWQNAPHNSVRVAVSGSFPKWPSRMLQVLRCGSCRHLHACPLYFHSFMTVVPLLTYESEHLIMQRIKDKWELRGGHIAVFDGSSRPCNARKRRR